ncbi:MULTISPECIES: hypothetical protein [Bacteroides]|uniref:hypothetical protein n=1 Tax=Bacteroides TaxID=816 RepID=UPI0018A116DF|nr:MULTISPECIES: hypothetical protein [Bacteroides]MDC2614310.1 hypothetical protein [Bacteroides ovatus]MDC2633608.1 hypothetical protein [Bacteroides ovatus]
MADLILYAVPVAVILWLLIKVLVKLHDSLIRRLPPADPDSDYVDADGNHIYYDRKFIARLERERQEATDNNKV